ncbi:methyltransferase domain-containing protein [Nocardiopsis mangrovi]|uniref:Protein-L-isoaspartate O-methyltransferase n=1 Tax=Nocardiopsis mangrovi TaxID=1179818 RepID=A0ABV9DYG5_9ACTN
MTAGARIARVLSSRGVIQDPAWHRAVLSVDRDAFVPDVVWAEEPSTGLYAPYPRDADPDVHRWLGEDVSLVTQVDDGHPAAAGGRGYTPTSSLSQPSLVVAMLQVLDVEDGHRVLEVGTGSGYNTALLCSRLGAGNVTSVEVDADVAADAEKNLAATGYTPHLIVGDGAAPVAGGPYDRVLSTVAVQTIPAAWLQALGPGGVIVTPWTPGPGFASSVLLRLIVDETGDAHGRVVGDAAFMMLRAHRPDRLGYGAFVDEDAPGVAEGTTATNPRWVTDPHPGWKVVLGHLVPHIGYASYEAAPDNTTAAGEATVYVFDRAGTSWVLGEYTPAGGPYEAKRHGPRDLWAEIAAARDVWERLGRPRRDRLGVTVAADGDQTLWVDGPGNSVISPCNG